MIRKIYNILVVDDHSIVLKGIEFLIKDVLFFQFHSATNYNTALDVIKSNQIHLVLLDLNINGSIDFEIVDKVLAIDNELKIIIFSAYDDSVYSQILLKKGAYAFLNKSNDSSIILKEIYDALGLDMGLSEHFNLQQSILEPIQDKNHLSTLSDREIQVAKLLINGCRGKDICYLLNLKMTTVSTYKKRIFEKLEITSTIELAKICKNI